MCTHKRKKLFKCYLCDMTFILEDGLKSHMHEFHLEDEANPSMQSYMNIQSAFPQEFIPQNIRSSVSFAAGSINQLSSMSTRPEENPSNFDNISQVSSQYEMSSETVSLNTLLSIDKSQLFNITEENEQNANTTSTSTNIDMDSKMCNTHLEQNISDQNFSNSSTDNHESSLTALGEFESNL